MLLAAAPPLDALAPQPEVWWPPQVLDDALAGIPTVATYKVEGVYIYEWADPVCGKFYGLGPGDPDATLPVARNKLQKIRFEMPYYANWTHFGVVGEPIVGGRIELGGSSDPPPWPNAGNNYYWVSTVLVPGNTPAYHMMSAWFVFSISTLDELQVTANGHVVFKDPYVQMSHPCEETTALHVTLT